MFEFWLNKDKVSKWAVGHCMCIYNDPKLRICITRSIDAYFYCKYVEYRDEMVERIDNPDVADLFCRNIRTDVQRLVELAKYNNWEKHR